MKFEKTTGKELETIITWTIVFMIYAMAIGYIAEWRYKVYQDSNYLPFSTVEIVVYLAGVFLLIQIIKYAFINKKIQICMQDIAVFISVIALALATIFAEKKPLALMGVYYTHEGLFINIIYLILFVAVSLIKENRNKKIIVYAFLGMALLQTMIAIFQSCLKITYFGIFDEEISRAMGTAFNPDPFGALMLMFAGFIFGVLLYSKEKRTILVLAFVAACISILLSGTRAAIVGFVFMIIVFAVLYKKHFSDNYFVLCWNQLEKKKKRIVIAVVFLTFLFLILAAYPIISDIFIRSIHDLNGGIINFASGRGKVWLDAWGKFLKKPVFGEGISNYTYVEYITIMKEDDILSGIITGYVAHNELLDIMVNQGIIGLSSFLFFLFTIYKRNIHLLKKENNPLQKAVLAGCFLAVTGYMMNAMFGLRVIYVTPYLYVLFGLMAPRYEKNNLETGK